MANSVLTLRLGNYVPYTDYNVQIELEIELERYSPLNRHFLGKSYFEVDGNQNSLIFQTISRYLKFVANSQNISSWRSIGLSGEEIKVVNGLCPSVNYVNEKLHLKFEGSFLAQTKVTYSHKNIVNIYIVYEVLQQEILMIQN